MGVVKDTGLLNKSESALGFSFGVRAQKEIKIYRIAPNFRGTKFSRIGHSEIFAEINFADRSMSEDSS